MEVKKANIKAKVKELWEEYKGMYFEDMPKTKEEFNERLPDIIKKGMYAAANTVLGLLFGSLALAYSAIPLGTAYLCSAESYVGFIYIGLAVSAASEKTGMALPLFLIYTALYLARVLVYRSFGREGSISPAEKTLEKEGAAKGFPLFGEGVGYKLVEGFAASLLISVYRAASFGFLYYDMIGGILEIATVPLFITSYEFAVKKKYRFNVRREIGISVIIFSLLFALRDIFLYGFSVSLLFAGLITLYMSHSTGVLRGGIYGLACGFACNPAVSPAFALMGMVSGALWRAGESAALASACLSAVVCSIYVEGWNSLTIYAPELLCAAVIFFPLVKFGKLPMLKLYGEGVIPADDRETAAILAEKRQEDTEKRFAELSEAFSELSKVFYTLSDRTVRPGILDTKQICDVVCDKYCTKCFYKSTCWDREYSSTNDVFTKIARALCERGWVDTDCVADYMLERCRNMDRILEKINDEHGSMLERMIKQNRTEVFAMDYESMAHLLASAVKHNSNEYLPDEVIRKKLTEALKHLRVSAKNICVYGKRKLFLIAGGVDITGMKTPVSEVKKCFENICGVRLTEPRFELDGDYVTMILESKRRFAVEYTARSNTKKNEGICGDLVCMFENGNDCFYSLISDGMGSGREAALTSRLCGIFLKKMLSSGNSKPVAMEMLNNFIRSKNTECFSTVDLLEIDLLNGNASFIKSGAVASYVVRGDRLFRIASNTMPVGITKIINAEEVTFALEDGDVIVMVSDGVGQTDEDMVRISELLTYNSDDDLERLADKIISNASQSCTRSDDVSVGIMRIKEL